jgi:hypothetical protein
LRRRLADQDGFSIVIAVVLLGIMMSSGLAAYAYVDNGQDQARVERVDESAFNLGEGALNAQLSILSRSWPGTAAQAYPECTQTAPAQQFCPTAAEMQASFGGGGVVDTDYDSGQPSWSTTIHDDEDGAFFDPDAASGWDSYDANGNDRLWVRSQATYTVGPRAGRSRALVALVEIETLNIAVQFPQRTVIAGKFETTNNGNKIIVQTNATQTSPHNVTLRCPNVSGNDNSCAKYRAPKQVTPPESISGGEYLDEQGQPLPALPEDGRDALRQQAVSNGTYYPTGCPSSAALASGLAGGGVVWVETGSCSYTGNTVFGSASEPAMLIFGSGTLALGGTTVFHGMIYMVNELERTDWLLQLGGNTEVDGRVFVDNWGGVSAGSSKVNITYNDFQNATQQFTTFGAAGIVQNSWREVTPSGG